MEQGLDALPVFAVIGGAGEQLRHAWTSEFPTVQFIFSDAKLVAGRARNTVLDNVVTPLVALLDADVVPYPGWLDKCCERLRNEGAAVVAPLILEAPDRIHAAGNLEYVNSTAGVEHLHKEHRFGGMPYGEKCDLEAAVVDYGEGHCLVCDVASVREVGCFDDGLVDFFEIDLAKKLRSLRKQIWFEPGAVVLFQQEAPIRMADVDTFIWRWDPSRIHDSCDRFAGTWGIDIAEEGRMDAFVRQYNRRLGALPRAVRAQWALTADRRAHEWWRTGRDRLRRARSR